MKKYIPLLVLLVGCADPSITLQAENVVYSEDDFYRLAQTIESEWTNMNFPIRDAKGCLTGRAINITVYPTEEFIELYGSGYRANTDARHEIAIRQDFYEQKRIDTFVHEMLHIAEKCVLDADINARMNHTNYLIWARNNPDSLESRVIIKEAEYLDSAKIQYASDIAR